MIQGARNMDKGVGGAPAGNVGDTGMDSDEGAFEAQITEEVASASWTGKPHDG